MKFKIITDGTGQYKVLNKFLWWESQLPKYSSVDECMRAIFRVWGKVPQDIKVETRVVDGTLQKSVSSQRCVRENGIWFSVSPKCADAIALLAEIKRCVDFFGHYHLTVNGGDYKRINSVVA